MEEMEIEPLHTDYQQQGEEEDSIQIIENNSVALPPEPIDIDELEFSDDEITVQGRYISGCDSFMCL